jgi:hypothetical protein
MNVEKGKRALMVFAKPADTAMNGHPPQSPDPSEKSPEDGPIGKNGGPRLDRGTQSRIGDQLRAMYTDLMEQPVPDKFKALLDQLDQRKEGDRQ